MASSDHPPFVTHAASELGVAAKTLKALAPQTYKTLIERSRAQRGLVDTVRFLRVQQTVRRSVEVSMNQGKIPTIRSIGAAFTTPGVLRSPKYGAYARAEIARAKILANRSTDIA
jgi:hypothetical protein